jgi:catechol 2,3-dioxygenase-like lactoylglutathione lyase family enzyme
MAKVVGIDHLSISVRDFKKSKEFYGKLLKFLGFKVLFQGKSYIGWTNGITRYTLFPVLPKYKEIKHEKGMVGFHHYAFELSKREDVDELYRFLLKNKVRILDAPKEYPEYGGPYYAVYFTDPDGLKLEGMHFPK